MTTLAELLGLWGQRDHRYSARKKGGTLQPLSDIEAESVRAFRLIEVRDLPEADQKLGLLALGRWLPPTVLR